MQSYQQTFAGAQTWVLNVPGSYFVTLQCTNPINVRLYKGGKKLDLGDMTGLLAGLEIGPLVEPGQIGYAMAFDRVEIDVTGADTIKIGIGNGAARYARLNGSMDLLTIQPAAAAIIQRTEAPSAFYASKGALAANTADTIFLAAANTNGAILLAAGSYTVEAGGGIQAFIANAAAPTTTIDGDIVHSVLSGNSSNNANNNLQIAQYIPAGKGLFYISDIALTATTQQQRNARYKLF